LIELLIDRWMDRRTDGRIDSFIHWLINSLYWCGDTAQKRALDSTCRSTVDLCSDRNSYCIGDRCRCRSNFTSLGSQQCRKSQPTSSTKQLL